MAIGAACFACCFDYTIDVTCLGTGYCSLSVTVVAVGIIGMVNIGSCLGWRSTVAVAAGDIRYVPDRFGFCIKGVGGMAID
jgi:hypothetical protein